MKNLLSRHAAAGLAAAALALSPLSAGAETLMMATTTSTQDSGLLEYLEPIFKKDPGIELKWVAVGTGQALKLGENCNADVLLVHAPAAEKAYVKAGHGIDRREVMYNDFVVVGPKNDPAKIAGKGTAEALKGIIAAKAGFVSRGDQSGTHKAEQKRKEGLCPYGSRHLDHLCRTAGRQEPAVHHCGRRQGAFQSVQRHDRESCPVPQGQEGPGQKV